MAFYAGGYRSVPGRGPAKPAAGPTAVIEHYGDPLGDPRPSAVQNVAFSLCLALVFLRFSMLHQLQTALMGINLRVLYLVGIPAMLALAAAGGIQRGFRGRPAFYWTAFTLWLGFTVPFSSWKGESALYFFDYLRTNLVMLFVIAGMAITWTQVKRVMYAVAAGGIVNLLTAGVFQSRLYGERYGERLSVITGSIGDPNDFGAHLLLVLPFLLWVALGTRSVLVRIGVVAGLAYGAYLIFRTGSRGALVALIIGLVFYMLKASARQRVALIALSPVVAAFVISMVPATTMNRITALSESAGGGEAIESRRSREYLLKTSIRYTFEHPLFGVGAGQFATYEGTHNIMPGMTRGSWHATHNTFTEVSSETGIPGLVLFAAGIVSTFILLNSTYKQARRRKDSRDIRVAAFCVMLGFATFCAAVSFLNFAYLFYFPAIAGLSISLWGAAREEFKRRDAARERAFAPAVVPAAPPRVRPLRRVPPPAPWLQ